MTKRWEHVNPNWAGLLRVVFSEGRGGVSVTQKVLKSTERLDQFQLNFQERCDLDNINSHKKNRVSPSL